MTLQEWCDKLQDLIKDKKEHFEITIHQENEISYGWEKDFNKEYCDKNNIPYRFLNRDGGAIVCFKGNIGIGFIYNNKKYKRWMLIKLLDDMCVYLKNKGLNATRERNDLLIDGYKVASGSSYNLEPDYKWSYETTQISIYSNPELIKNICLKSMIKEPKALSDFGISQKEILDFLNQWKGENIYE